MKYNNLCSEKDVIEAFLDLLSAYDTLITYNGMGFDIPYLKSKCAELQIEEHFDEFHFIDIFKEISPLKHSLKLTDCKQKTVEAFLGIPREDSYTGKELIEIYQNYTKYPNKEWLTLLLLHNYEDVLGLSKLTLALAYVSLFHGEFACVAEVKINDTQTYEGKARKELILKLSLKYPLPTPVSCQKDEIYLSADNDTASIVVCLTESEMKYFYKNYRDYYYLPDEDTVIHKSIAVYMEKEYRQAARASNCYTKKYGFFLPQYNSSLVTPEFFTTYKGKNSYFIYNETLLENLPLLTLYAKLLLKQLASKK